MDLKIGDKVQVIASVEHHFRDGQIVTIDALNDSRLYAVGEDGLRQALDYVEIKSLQPKSIKWL